MVRKNMKKLVRTLLGLLLVPAVFAVAWTTCNFITNIDTTAGMFRIFERGILVYLLIHTLLLKPVYLYVLNHELVHVLATWLCGGRVVSFNVSPKSGKVITSKTNFFIELSPYFISLYTILLWPLFLTLKSIGPEINSLSSYFVFFTGFTLAFHFVMTSEALRFEQSDVLKSGFIFSFVLILLGNLIIVMAVVCSYFDNISFTNFIKESFSTSKTVYNMVYSKTAEFINNFNLVKT